MTTVGPKDRSGDDQEPEDGAPDEGAAMSEDELDEALDDSFPASDPLPPPSRPGGGD